MGYPEPPGEFSLKLLKCRSHTRTQSRSLAHVLKSCLFRKTAPMDKNYEAQEVPVTHSALRTQSHVLCTICQLAESQLWETRGKLLLPEKGSGKQKRFWAPIPFLFHKCNILSLDERKQKEIETRQFVISRQLCAQMPAEQQVLR